MTDTGMGVWDAPYQPEVDAAQNSQDLTVVWNKYSAGTEAGPVLDHLRMALQVRQAELESGPPEEVVTTSLAILAQNETDSYEAQLAYANALDRFGRAHTAFKTLRAKTYVRMRPDHRSAADTDNYVDADDAVASARLEEYLAEGLVKAAKSNLDRLERQFQYHRSLMVNERKVDSRPSITGL